MPELSIITINLNNKSGLDITIRSVIAQTYKNYEYIVIDGGSDDGSTEIINQHKDRITKWISEKDSGIYNAMNKGIRYATGVYCLFLNSGDYFCSENTLTEVFEMNPVEDIVYGNMVIEDPVLGKMPGRMPDAITLKHMVKDTLWHPVSFIKRELFNKYGYYREDLKIASDYDFFFKNIVINKIVTRHIPVPIAVFNLNGMSSVAQNAELVKKERRRVQLQYIDEKKLDYIQHEISKEQSKLGTDPFFSKIIQWLKHRV